MPADVGQATVASSGATGKEEAMQALILAQNGADEIAFTPDLTGFVALAAGILIFAVPRALNYIVAAYLVVVGLILLFNVRI
jgi:hypothetical protein